MAVPNTYLKTAVYAALGEASKGITPWELQFWVTESQRAIASMLPWQMVPEIVEIARNPASSVADSTEYGVYMINGAVYSVPALEIIGISVDTSNFAGSNIHTSPVPAIEVSPTEFFYKLSDWMFPTAGSYVYCQKNGKIITNFAGGTGWAANGSTGTPIMVMYKRLPNAIPLTGGWRSSTVLSLNMQSPGSVKYATATTKKMSDYASVPNFPLSNFVGGLFIQAAGSADPTSPVSDNVVAKILSVEDVDVSGNQRIRVTTDTVLNTWTAAAVLVKRPVSDTTLWPIEDTYLSSKWYLTIIDHALSSIWLKLGDGNRSQMYMKSFVERMNSMGATAKAI